MIELDFRNINGVRIGTDNEEHDEDTFLIAQRVLRNAAAIEAIHVVGVEGFGIVTIHRGDDHQIRMGWIEPGYSPGAAFKYGGPAALAWAIEQRRAA